MLTQSQILLMERDDAVALHREYLNEYQNNEGEEGGTSGLSGGGGVAGGVTVPPFSLWTTLYEEEEELAQLTAIALMQVL